MKLNAILTTGWDYKKSLGLTAKQLHEEALRYSNYIEGISSQLIENNTNNIYHLEQLFRKRTRGSNDIKKLVGALTEIQNNNTLNCHIDIFAYSFLKGAKNFDLLLPFDKEHKQNKDFIDTYKQWQKCFRKLEQFERFGIENIFLKCNDWNKDKYLELRKIVSRPSARDEIRTLATLLVSGPSTLKEVSKDLGLNYTLGQRTIGVFVNIGVVEKREHIIIFILSLLIKTKLSQPVSLLLQNYQEIYAILLQNYQEIYAISNEALPVVIFCLRETIGLDLLSNLDLEGK